VARLQTEDEERRARPGRRSCDPSGTGQVFGYSILRDSEVIGLTEEEKRAIRD
jgi:hypothetical protein